MMGAKEVLYNRLKDCDNAKTVEVPKSMRPTKEPTKEMGEDIAWWQEMYKRQIRMMYTK